ncbi:RAM signaling pathway protein [Teratosphaeria destructans]|uniref:Cell wall hydroxyproline-rich glycoprotein n=1 Tax=Teratosphaeria destructans TaxID=418781 RepID=A0A9W7SKV6_9PEZI|nr:RAM signaling pathway protein [Teratosphaeria destructans]
MFTPSLSFLACSLLLSSPFTNADGKVKKGDGKKKADVPKHNEYLERDKKILLDWKAKNVVDDPFGWLANWSEHVDVCDFGRISCDPIPDGDGHLAVSGIDFNGALLGGPPGGMSIDPLVGGLNDLVFFHANTNNFSTGIRDDYSHLPYFQEMDISTNLFKGPFPLQFYTAKEIVFVDIRFNAFSGPIPREAFLVSLLALFFNDNQFTGTIPDTIGSADINYLNFGNNPITGTIPKDFPDQTDLLQVVLVGTELEGPIPEGPWKSTDLEFFYASETHLSGKIPESLCLLPKLDLINVTLTNIDKELGPACTKMQKKKKLFL